MGARCAAVIMVFGLVLAVAAGAETPRIVAVKPARTDSLLVCRLVTAGMPGREIMSTLQSGLASAVHLQFDVLDARDRTVADHSLRLHLAYDLWEEIYAVTHGGTTLFFNDDRTLKAWFDATPWLPLAPLSALAGMSPLRLRAALRLHVIAPSAREHLGSIVAGPDGQEVSVGLGRLIRFFYQEGRRDRRAGSAHSQAFRLEELEHAQD